METFFVEQADGTWHKMHLPEGVERNIKNAVFEGTYRSVDNEEMSRLRKDKEQYKKVEMFMSKGEYGVPKFNFAIKIEDVSNS